MFLDLNQVYTPDLVVSRFEKSKQASNHPSVCLKASLYLSLCSSDTEYNPSREEQDEHEMENSTEFAVVINGHSLVHALHPQLEQLFLEVSSQCKCC